MSEFWVSKKKYLCRYCDIYIADDAPSRQQHEGGLRHQGNKARFVREIYKTGERRKRDKEDEKRELARLEQAANESYARDIASGAAAGVGPIASSSSAPPPRPSTSAGRTAPSRDVYANYSTAEQLGYVDEEANKAAAEKALKMTEGRIGEWTVVPTPLPPASSSTPSSETPPAPATSASANSALPDDDDIRGWRFDNSKRRRLAVGLGDIYDPGIIEVKKKEEETPPPPPPEPKAERDPAGSGATELPKWAPRRWLKPGEAPPRTTPPQDDSSFREENAKGIVKEEEESNVLPDEPLQGARAGPSPPAVKEEEPESPKPRSTPEPSSTGLFRKRKAPASGAGTRGSRR